MSGRHQLARAEWLAVMAACALLVAWHVRELHWGRFVVAFAAIDLVGYLPGVLARRRAGGGPVAPLYQRLYDVTHNFLTAALAATIWGALAGGPEWAMLALPLHLAGDRGLFGNGLTSARGVFEVDLEPSKGSRPPATGLRRRSRLRPNATRVGAEARS